MNNLVDLTAREHFLCHYLLTKMYRKGSEEWYKMIHAFLMMKAGSAKQDRYSNSRLYEAARKNFSQVMSRLQSGERNSQHGTRWIHNPVMQKSKKIPKDAPLPEDWKEGRKIKWNLTKTTGSNSAPCATCANCGRKYTRKNQEKYCSLECRSEARKKRTRLYGREEEFLAWYKKHRSMNKALKEMGFDNRGARYHWAKSVLEKQKERN